MVKTQNQNISAISTPFIYSAVKIGVNSIHHIQDTKQTHIAIMTTVVFLQDFVFGDKNSGGNFASGIYEGSKVFIKLSARLLCSIYMEDRYYTKSYASKSICIAAGSIASSIYSIAIKGKIDDPYEEVPKLIYKAVVSVPTHLGADIIRKYLEPDYNEQNLANADHILYRIAAREYDFLHSNIAHSISLHSGKEFIDYVISFVKSYVYPSKDSQNNATYMVINKSDVYRTYSDELSYSNHSSTEFELCNISAIPQEQLYSIL